MALQGVLTVAPLDAGRPHFETAAKGAARLRVAAVGVAVVVAEGVEVAVQVARGVLAERRACGDQHQGEDERTHARPRPLRPLQHELTQAGARAAMRRPGEALSAAALRLLVRRLSKAQGSCALPAAQHALRAPRQARGDTARACQHAQGGWISTSSRAGGKVRQRGRLV